MEYYVTLLVTVTSLTKNPDGTYNFQIAPVSSSMQNVVVYDGKAINLQNGEVMETIHFTNGHNISEEEIFKYKVGYHYAVLFRKWDITTATDPDFYERQAKTYISRYEKRRVKPKKNKIIVLKR